MRAIAALPARVLHDRIKLVNVLGILHGYYHSRFVAVVQRAYARSGLGPRK